MAILAALCFLAAPLRAAPQNRDRKSKITRQCEITLRLIEARSIPVKTAEDASTLVPAELKNLLRFQHYGLIDSAYVRGREEETLRIALAVTLQGRLKFLVEDKEGVPALRFEVVIEAAPNPKGERSRLLETETTLRNGESVVLGASRMQGADRALIVLLTAKLIP